MKKVLKYGIIAIIIIAVIVININLYGSDYLYWK